MNSQAQPRVVFHLGFHEPLPLTVCSLQHHSAMAGTVRHAQCSPRMQEALGSSSNITESRHCFPFFIFILENCLCSCFCMCKQLHLLVHVCVCVWLCVHVCMCKCQSPRLTSEVHLIHRGRVSQLSQSPQESWFSQWSPFYPLCTNQCLPSICTDDGESHSCPCACLARAIIH